AIAGALATIGAKFAQMTWWQFPLIVIGVMLAISMPAVIIAWLKLRQRTLGPILDANGWAINGRVKINIPFGTALTALPVLPPGSVRSLEDPYEDKEAARARRNWIALLVLLALVAIAWWVRWDANQHKDADKKAHYFWEADRPAPLVATSTTPEQAPPKK
ncbi:MAG: hypothetical protein ABIZ49_09645, partial [Opitutaceae bacterium]